MADIVEEKTHIYKLDQSGRLMEHWESPKMLWLSGELGDGRLVFFSRTGVHSVEVLSPEGRWETWYEGMTRGLGNSRDAVMILDEGRILKLTNPDTVEIVYQDIRARLDGYRDWL